MITYSKDDINYDLAYRAHTGTSFVPEERAARHQADYVQHMSEVVSEFEQWTTEDNMAEVAAALEAYRAGYVQRYHALLGARARIVSPMIAGPSGWKPADVRRNERANASADKALDELLTWSRRTLERLRNTYNPRRIANAPVRVGDSDAVEKLRAKIAEAEALQARMKSANRIARGKGERAEKVEALMGLGFSERNAELIMTPDQLYGVGFAPYQLSNNNATIKRLRDRIAAAEAEQARRAEPVPDREVNGVTVSENAEADRLQLFFDGKPAPEVIAALKRRGFHWSPRNCCWQRQLTDNARRAAAEVLAVVK